MAVTTRAGRAKVNGTTPASTPSKQPIVEEVVEELERETNGKAHGMTGLDEEVETKERDFFWTYTEEPHRTRRLAIIKAHPEVWYPGTLRRPNIGRKVSASC
jgi:hypothetical protein